MLRPEAFVPEGFTPLASLVTDRFRLEPLGPQHNTADHAAWTSSIEHIRATAGYRNGDWPPPNGMSLDANLSDLRRHAADFAARRGFTFTVLDPADSHVVIGLVRRAMSHRDVYGGSVPVLDANDPLPWRPRRIVVAGSSGAGKTTLAARIAALLGVPHVELDGLFHGPGWTTRESFAADVDAFSARPSWVTEWQYPAARAVLAERADLLVWLDFSRATVMRRVVRRTVRRRLRRQVLWNGNIEAALWTVLTDPEHVVRLAWSTWPDTAARVAGLHRQHPELVIVRLADPRAARHWLSGPLRRAGDLPTDWHSR